MANLEDYLMQYGSLLGKQAERRLQPLHVPGQDELPKFKLLRQPFEAQAHCIAALVKTWKKQQAAILVAEMGTGKTLMAMAAVHTAKNGKPYRALVFCPGQLTEKWTREIVQTIPGAQVTILETWKDVTKIDRHTGCNRPTWYVIARDRAKLGAKWKGVYNQTAKRDSRGQLVKQTQCPKCGQIPTDQKGEVILRDSISKRQSHCQNIVLNIDGTPKMVKKPDGTPVVKRCDSPLWQMTDEIRRYEPALYIKRRLKKFFDFLILDEIHETKSAISAQGNAAGSLAAACKKTLALTGTLIGGYAEHIRPLLFRLAPQSVVRDGFDWKDAMPFNEMYGRIETRVTEREDDGDDNKMSRGKTKTSKTKYVRPGIMPTLFGKHLIDKAVFLSLSEVSDNLPKLQEDMISVNMDKDLAANYYDIQDDLMDEIKELLKKGNKQLLGKMLNTLLCYPDYPFDWSPIGYYETNDFGEQIAWHPVTNPPCMDKEKTYAKEQALLDYVKSEKSQGRQCWVFVQYTDTRPVLDRLADMLKQQGLKVGVLKASVSLAKREAWIAKNGPKCDVILSHPMLVQTGLDLFDKSGKHNFCTLCFYETGYNLFTLRQASRRAWRIGQQKDCKVAYFYYADTMQERAMNLMSKKLMAAKALEGEFSEEGLVAMSGDDEANAEVALAKSLTKEMGDISRRNWKKLGA